MVLPGVVLYRPGGLNVTGMPAVQGMQPGKSVQIASRQPSRTGGYQFLYWVEEDGISVTPWRTGSPEAAALYDRSYLAKKDKYSSFLGGNQPLCVIENPDIRDGSKILLIRDSYSDSLAPFLAQCQADALAEGRVVLHDEDLMHEISPLIC